MRRPHFIIPAMLAVAALLAAACGGGGGGGAAWCADIDEIVSEGWDEYDSSPGYTDHYRWSQVRDMDIVVQYFDYVAGSELERADLEGFAEALDDAVEAGNRYDGRAAVRAWEESLRDACGDSASEASGTSQVDSVSEVATDEADPSDSTAAASLSDAATEIAGTLTDAAADVGDAKLTDIANEITDAAKRLAIVAKPDYGDLEELSDTSHAVWELNEAIERYLESASTIATAIITETDQKVAALNATRLAADFVIDSSWHEEWDDISLAWEKLNIETNAIRYNDDDAERYFEAIEATNRTFVAKSRANAEYQVAVAEWSVANDRITWRDNQ